MATTIQTDNPETRDLLNRVMQLGSFTDLDDLLHEFLIQHLLATPELRDTLAHKIQEGLDSESMPWNTDTQEMLRGKMRKIASEVEQENTGE